jgi:hypothetical protein
MNSVFNITPKNSPSIQKYKDNAIRDLNKFFGQDWIYNTPKIFIVDDRKTIDLLREQKTEDWVVGWSWGRTAIFILNPKNISKESCHDGKTYNIEKLIKHELCHSFFESRFGQSKFGWINEGVCVYVAGQLDKYSMPLKFNGFLDGNKIYQESGNAIKLIIDNFGKQKLFEFLDKQSVVGSKKELKRVFKEVFGGNLNYRFFNELKDK